MVALLQTAIPTGSKRACHRSNIAVALLQTVISKASGEHGLGMNLVCMPSCVGSLIPNWASACGDMTK